MALNYGVKIRKLKLEITISEVSGSFPGLSGLREGVAEKFFQGIKI